MSNLECSVLVEHHQALQQKNSETKARNFLSKAYIPQQKIKNGEFIIKAFEGYITEISFPKEMKNNQIIQTYAKRLLEKRPTNINNVEEFILKINDLPGYSSRAVFVKDENNENGVKVIIKPTDKKKNAGSISYDNFASRYSGVNEVKASYNTVLAPMHQTTVTGSSSLFENSSNSGGIQHDITIAPDLKLGLSANTVKTYPGYKLKPYDINSSANLIGVSLNYQVIRQRQENLSPAYEPS